MTHNTEHDQKTSRSWSRINKIGTNPAYLQGLVSTPRCMVGVYSQGGDHPYTVIDFVYNGRHHTRSWNRYISERGLAILANRFVRQKIKTAWVVI